LARVRGRLEGCCQQGKVAAKAAHGNLAGCGADPTRDRATRWPTTLLLPRRRDGCVAADLKAGN